MEDEDPSLLLAASTPEHLLCASDSVHYEGSNSEQYVILDLKPQYCLQTIISFVCMDIAHTSLPVLTHTSSFHTISVLQRFTY